MGNTIRPDLTERLMKAREVFIIESRPYFEALSKVYLEALVGYREDRSPIYSESGEQLIQSIYENIEYLKDKIMKDYELSDDEHFPTITRKIKSR